MVAESNTWKRDLLRRKQLFLRYNSTKQFGKNEDATYSVLEKAVFYSAFIIRKLIDCKSKLSDKADKYTLKVLKLKPTNEIHSFTGKRILESYDWEHTNQETAPGKDICNWLIHSYVFFFNYHDDDTVEGFYVASDYDRNKALYYIDICDWLDYMDFIANDEIREMEAHYDMTRKD